MEFYDVVKSRRTIRDFSGKKVDKKTLERILSAGLAAPTNDHLRNWEFVVLTEREVIEKIIKPIPKEYVMPCFLAIGHPLSKVKSPKQIKQKIRDKIHYNKW